MESISSVDLSDENILGTLWGQLFLQFSTECLKTLQMLSAWNGWMDELGFYIPSTVFQSF